MGKAFWVIAAVLTCGAQAFDYFYIKALKNGAPRQGTVWKASASACFLLIGAIALTQCARPLSGWLIFLGLFFGLAGDVVLQLRYLYPKKHDLCFALGMLLFGLGHLCYIAALLFLDAPAWLPAVPVCAVMLLLVKLYTVWRGVEAGKLLLPGTIYLTITCYMGALAAVVAVRGFSVGTMLFAIGGVLFPISDSILTAHSFGRKRRVLQSMLLHITYYLAQCLIAAAICFL